MSIWTWILRRELPGTEAEDDSSQRERLSIRGSPLISNVQFSGARKKRHLLLVTSHQPLATVPLFVGWKPSETPHHLSTSWLNLEVHSQGFTECQVHTAFNGKSQREAPSIGLRIPRIGIWAFQKSNRSALRKRPDLHPGVLADDAGLCPGRDPAAEPWL